MMEIQLLLDIGLIRRKDVLEICHQRRQDITAGFVNANNGGGEIIDYGKNVDLLFSFLESKYILRLACTQKIDSIKVCVILFDLTSFGWISLHLR